MNTSEIYFHWFNRIYFFYTVAPSDELSTAQNISTPYQGALQRSDSIDSSKSSEKSCY
jgi:hypothetical protein